MTAEKSKVRVHVDFDVQKQQKLPRLSRRSVQDCCETSDEALYRRHVSSKSLDFCKRTGTRNSPAIYTFDWGCVSALTYFTYPPTNSEQEVPPIPDNQITARALFDPTSQDKRTMNKASPVDDEPTHVDAAEKIYDTVKGVWGWGKTVVIVSPFLGMAEILAGKVVESAGTSLEDVDNAVTGKLQGLDDGILNPVIHVVVKTMMDAAIQTGDFIGPIVLTILKPLDFMLKSEPENGPSPHAVTRPAA